MPSDPVVCPPSIVAALAALSREERAAKERLDSLRFRLATVARDEAAKVPGTGRTLDRAARMIAAVDPDRGWTGKALHLFLQRGRTGTVTAAPGVTESVTSAGFECPKTSLTKTVVFSWLYARLRRRVRPRRLKSVTKNVTLVDL